MSGLKIGLMASLKVPWSALVFVFKVLLKLAELMKKIKGKKK